MFLYVGNTALGYCNEIKKQSNRCTGLLRHRLFQEVEVRKFRDNGHVKVVKLSALETGLLYPQEILLVLIPQAESISGSQCDRKYWVNDKLK
jgi:hypothetical protein